MQPIGHDSAAGVEGDSGSGRGHGCCFETLTPLTGRKQSHHETESSNLLSPKSFGLVIALALRHSLLALSWLHCSANHSPHTPPAPSLESTNTLIPSSPQINQQQTYRYTSPVSLFILNTYTFASTFRMYFNVHRVFEPTRILLVVPE
jgi:hypothetical protein